MRRTVIATTLFLLASLGGQQVFAQGGGETKEPGQPSAPASPAAKLAAEKKAAVASLSGTTWKVKVTPNEAAAARGEKPFDDTLVFKDDRVTMTECVKYGFNTSAYKLAKVGDNWSFHTRQESADQGKTLWRATIRGNEIQGTMTWTKGDGQVVDYSFEGKKAS